MGLFSASKEEKIDRRRSLAGVPVLNRNVAIDEGDGKGLMVVVRLGRRKGFWARFAPPVIERKLRLDDLGGFVVRMIDGQRTVKEIIDAFVARYQTNRREAELSVAEFMKSLAERRVISIVIK